MSILNHFGKVKASYKKYESDLPEYTGYIFINKYCYGGQINLEGINGGIKDRTFNFSNKAVYQGVNDVLILPFPHNKHISTTYYHDNPRTLFSFTNLVETFSKCYEKVKEKMYSELWKTIECCPFINIIDLLILKQSDTDKHIEHLEEIVKALIDDNKLLQTKINSLESQMSLFKTKIPVAVAISASTSNSCEKTIAEEILNE